MNTATTTNNEIYQLGLSQDIDNDTQTQYLTKKIAKLESKGIPFKAIANKDAVQYSSIAQRVIKSCNFIFDSYFSDDNKIYGIVYYSKQDKINLNGIISYDEKVYSRLSALWIFFKDIFIKQDSSFRFWCSHFALAWAMNELDLKNINDLSDLKKSCFFTKFDGKEASTKEILTYYSVYYKTHNDINNETNQIKFSSNNFGTLLQKLCCDMQKEKEQVRTYLFITPPFLNVSHAMALKIIIKNNVVKIKFYDPNDTLREQNIVFNSINHVHNLQLKDLLDLKHRISYQIDNPINPSKDKENFTLKYIPAGYSITQNKIIKGMLAIKNSMENVDTIMDEMQNNFKKAMLQFEDKSIEYMNDFNAKCEASLNARSESFNKKLDALSENITEKFSISRKNNQI